ncbi:MAG: tRNA (guanine-N2)-dimethyltransferase [Thermodesulfobacteria bacterium]|nr:tRNA (guanine-N2)-dimethyltransferase [Thermodesulfobacteriota bacterium]
MEYLVLERRIKRMEEVLKKRQKDLVLFIERVRNQHNFSALIRTAEAVGIMDIYYSYEEGKKASINEAITIGAHQWVFIHEVSDPVKVLKEFRDKGFQIVVTWLGVDTLDFREVDYTKPTVIVVGNEVEGVSKELLPFATHKIKIPMVGMVQSLNVSVATGVILYEAYRQREKAGLYEEPQLTRQEIKEILYKWGYENVLKSKARSRAKI